LGAYGDGRPFYAMRFIKGDNLKQAIGQFHQKLSTDFTDSTDKNVRESAKSVKSVDTSPVFCAWRKPSAKKRRPRQLSALPWSVADY
jgi:hypothetical protein